MRLVIFLLFQVIDFASFADNNIEQFIKESMDGLKIQNQAHAESWGLGTADT